MNGKDFSVYIVMNHESSWFGFLHWTAITTRDAYKLHVGYKYLRYPPRRAGVWNPSTLLCLPSLEDLYFYFAYFFDFYKPHTRNHATRFIENNYRLRIWKWNFNLLKNIYITIWVQSYLITMWFSHTLLEMSLSTSFQ
jgi:hypothetical protein